MIGYAILKNRLLDIELLAYDTLPKAAALTVVMLPLPIGMAFARSFSGTHGLLLFRAAGTLAAILAFSLGVLFLRKYQEPAAQRLRGVASLAFPFIVGALLTMADWVKVVAVVLSAIFAPRIFSGILDSVSQWLAEVFKGRRSFRHSLRQARRQSYRMSNLPDLVEETKRKVSEALGVERATLYFHDVTSNQFIAIGPEAEKQPVYGENHPLVKRLALGPVFRDYTCGLPDGVLAASPLYQESGLFGFFLIGPVRHPGAGVTVRMLESARLDIEHPLMIAHIYYENAVTLDKFCHDNIRYAGNIPRDVAGLMMVPKGRFMERSKSVLPRLDSSQSLGQLAIVWI